MTPSDPATTPRALEHLTHDGLTWVDIQNPTRGHLDILAQEYQFHPLNLDDCLSKIQLTKIDDHQDYLFLVLHFPSERPERSHVASNQVSVFLGKDYLITLHDGAFKSLSNLFEVSKRDEHQRHAFMTKSSGYLLYRIIDKLIDDLFPFLDKLLNDLNEIEEFVFDEIVSAVRQVNQLRREIAALRRIIFPLRRLIVELAPRAQRFTPQDLSAYFSDVRDHIEKVWETLDESKETIEIYKDTDFILNTETSAQILAVLTIIFTLTIPIVTIGTLYGMNVNLPGATQAGPWTFLGPYTAFILLLLSSGITSLAMAWYFHRRGWL